MDPIRAHGQALVQFHPGFPPAQPRLEVRPTADRSGGRDSWAGGDGARRAEAPPQAAHVRCHPGLVAADPALREQLLVRAGRATGSREWERSRKFYLQEGRIGLDHAIVSLEMEEVFENGRHLGVRMAQPYWDPDLVDLLYRIPPDVLNRGGRAKGLVRQTLARRFPDLGLERQKKVIATNYFTSVMLGQGREIWQQMGGAQALAELGVVDGSRVQQAAQHLFSSGTARAANRIWNILNLEAWVRPRI